MQALHKPDTEPNFCAEFCLAQKYPLNGQFLCKAPSSHLLGPTVEDLLLGYNDV